MSLNKYDFLEYLRNEITLVTSEYIDIVSGNVHRKLGGYPDKNHRMPSCCNAMIELMNNDDKILGQPKKGKGATLRIRYYKR